MALTRKFLSALGIDADKIDEILTAHLDTVNEIKAERDTYKADAEKLPGVQAELEAEKGKKSYKAEYEALKTEHDQYKATVEAEKAADAKKAAYRKLLVESGIPEKRLDTVLRLADLEKITLAADGTVDKAEDVKKGITEEWKDIIPEVNEKGADTPTPPGGTGGGTGGVSRAAQVAQKHYEAIYGVKKKEA